MKILGLMLILGLANLGVRARPANEVQVRPNVANDRPIIGVLLQPSVSNIGDEFVRTTYVHFIEMGGARVVPIRCKRPREYYEKIVKKINGVVFPGGDTIGTAGPYYEAAKTLYELAVEINDGGDYFPIWGVCLGLDVMAYLRTGVWPLAYSDAKNLTLPLTFTEGFKNSRTFGDMPDHLVHYLETEPITQNNHNDSLLIRDFYTYPELRDFYHVLATGHGRDKLEFVAFMEAYNYPFYATQWHPEKAVFLWSLGEVIDHSPHIIKVAQYMANFFVGEAMKSSHHFDSVEEEINSLIENSYHFFLPSDRFLDYYYFNFSDPAIANREILYKKPAQVHPNLPTPTQNAL